MCNYLVQSCDIYSALHTEKSDKRDFTLDTDVVCNAGYGVVQAVLLLQL